MKKCAICNSDLGKNKKYCSKECRYKDSFFKNKKPWNHKENDSIETIKKKKDVSKKRIKTLREKYGDSIPVWNTGLTKENNESLKSMAENRKGKKNPIHKVINDAEKYEEWCNNISNSLKGKNTGSLEERYGLEKSIEIKEKQSKSAKERKVHGHTGFKHSEESKNKMREATAKRIANGSFKHCFTKPMKIFLEILKELKIDKEFDIEHFCKYYTIDFADVKNKIAVEIDGDFFHSNPLYYKKPLHEVQKKNAINDRKKEIFLKKEGWNIIRFWENDLLNNREKVKDEIGEFRQRFI